MGKNFDKKRPLLLYASWGTRWTRYLGGHENPRFPTRQKQKKKPMEVERVELSSLVNSPLTSTCLVPRYYTLCLLS
ncbi:putative cytosolic protein [Chlamydia trachomatis A2497]|uniref:Putative cytosolic protein n=1 Tax=Chlamydia trachomatis serovar A (strain A2497) TaxID=580047 RepID=G4NNW9_CHLT4|nr:putative cytosolic protein [Chlamydia trachomatis A2497]